LHINKSGKNTWIEFSPSYEINYNILTMRKEILTDQGNDGAEVQNRFFNVIPECKW
jgi:hypothetical protein